MQTNTIKCLGCGSTLQIDSPTELGYVKSLEQPFCQNCFRLMHYGKADLHFHPDKLPTFKKDSLILVVSSILYLDTILTSDIKRLNDQYQVTYIINQIDLLPAATNKNHLLGSIKKQFKNFRVSYDDVILMSALNRHDIDQLKEYILDNNARDVYLIGLQNSGKTTIFKALTNNKEALASPKAALTQTILHGKYLDSNIYDTPGLYQSGYLHEVIDFETYKKLLPTKRFNPRNGKLALNDSILINGLVGVSVIKGNTHSVLYASDNVKYHLTKDDRALTILKEGNVFDLSFDEYDVKDYSLKEETNYQLTLADFGVLRLSGPVSIRVYSAKGLHISLIEGFFR